MRKNNIQIRKATEDDYASVNALYRQSYELHYCNIPNVYKVAPEVIISRGTYINTLDDEDSAIFIAEKNKKIIGVINVLVEIDEGNDIMQSFTRISIEEFIVTEQERKKGIGGALMARAEEWAKEKGIKDMTVVVYGFNEEAVAFYKKNHYKPISMRLDKKL